MTTVATAFIAKLAIHDEAKYGEEKANIGTGFFCEGKFYRDPEVGTRFHFSSDDEDAEGGLVTSTIKSVCKVGSDTSPDKLVLPTDFPKVANLRFPTWPGQPGEIKAGDWLISTINSIYWLGSLKAEGRS